MKISETTLTTLPSKTFYQGALGDTDYETPIHITYYTDCVELEQQGNGSVLISRGAFEALVKSIRKDLSA